MALKYVVEKIDDIPEALRSEYAEKDGKFVLNVADLPEDPSPQLKKALDNERKARIQLEDQVKSWKKSGKTPEEIEALVEQSAKLEEERLRNAGEWDKLKAQMNQKHEEALKAERAKLESKDSEIKAMKRSLESHLIDAEATAAIAANKGIPDLLLPHVQKFIKVVEDNGKYSIKVVDSKGDPRVNGKGDPLTIYDLVTELKSNDIYGRAFEASGNSGTGMRPPGGSSNTLNVNKRSDLKNERERAAFIDEYGLEAYQSLPF